MQPELFDNLAARQHAQPEVSRCHVGNEAVQLALADPVDGRLSDHLRRVLHQLLQQEILPDTRFASYPPFFLRRVLV